MNWWVLKRKVHSSWLIAWLSIGFIFGIFAAQYFSVSFWLIYLGLVILSAAFYKKYLGFIPLVIVAGTILGLVRGDQLMTELRSFDQYVDKTVSVVGTIDDISEAGSGLKAFCLGGLRVNGNSMSGQIYVTAEVDGAGVGDSLELNGNFKKGFGRYEGVIYRAELVSHWRSVNSTLGFKGFFSGLIRKSLPENEADLGLGFLLGEKNELSADIVTALQLAGLTHIVVASGYNLTVLVRIARRLFLKVSKYLSLLTSLIMIFGFVSITGSSPSMVRAGIVSVLSLLAWYYGRKFHPIILLVVVASLTLIYDPSYLWSDIGWQLSFAAFAGVMVIAPLATRYFFDDTKVGFLPQLLIETVSAQIATLPILIVNFGQISNVALIANLLVLPFVPLAMLLVFLTGLLTWILPAISWIIIAPTTWLLDYMISITMFFAELPWAVTSIKFGWLIGILIYATIIIFCLYMQRKTKFSLREVNLVE